MKTGDEYFDSEEFHDMLQEYEQARNTGAPVFLDADELSEIADYYQMQGQMDYAETAIEQALERSPGAIAPLTYRIHEALYNGNIEAAKNYLERIVEKDEPDYVYDCGEIMIAEGHANEADSFFRENFKTVSPDEYQDYVVDVANIFADYGLSEKAMEWVSQAKPENTPDFKELMARTLYGLGKFKDSEKLFNELLDTDPFQKRYWNALASAQFMNEDYTASVQSSEYAIAIDPNDLDGLLTKANGLYRLGNYEEALIYFRRYSEHEPYDELALLHQSTCLINLGRTDDAIETLKNAFEMAGRQSEYQPDICQELAFAYSEKGQTDEALAWLDKTDNMDCDHNNIQVIKGHVLIAAKRIHEGLEQYRQAVLNSDDMSKTTLRIVVSLYDNKYPSIAYLLFKKFYLALNNNDDDGEGYAYMALCCFDLKKTDEFLEYLEKACQRNPKECKLVLGHLFPENVEPQNYYNYIKEKMKL